MTVDPDPIAERQRTISRSELEMDDVTSMGEVVETDDAIAELLSD